LWNPADQAVKARFFMLYSPGLYKVLTFLHVHEVPLSPILVRPVREQLEHDRVIRVLQAKYKRKFEVAINPGNEQTTPVTVGALPWYPDLVLQSTERGRRLLGVVEVETAESVNNLEAMSQWATFGRLRAPFYLYVPASNIDTARQLCTNLQIPVAEVWAYTALGDQLRFTLVQKTARPAGEKAPSEPARPAAPRRVSTPARSRVARSVAARPARRAAKKAPRAAARKKVSSSGRSRAQKRK
jgi:hypothetical protein